MAKSTPAQTFKRIFDTWMHPSTDPKTRSNAERKMDAWLKRNGKTFTDISAILAQAAAEIAAAAPPPPPSDPRDAQPHPFEDPRFTPVGLVHGIVLKYLVMEENVAVVYSLWIVFTHVYTQFEIAPRIALESDEPDAGKSTARKVGSHLAFRPNEETLGSEPAIREHLDRGPGTVFLDELDLIEMDTRRALLRLWNLGHERGAKIGLKEKGKRKLYNIHAPILGAGLGSFLERVQYTRTFGFRWNRTQRKQDRSAGTIAMTSRI
jgi:hypothetical protein